MIVMADSDIFDDRFWVRVENVYGKRVAAPFADNAAFVLNAVENLTGSSDLISLRTRATNDRPFTVVKKLQADAQARFQQEADALQARLTDTQNRLRELEQGASVSGAPATATSLTPEQQAEIEQFKRELIETRTELRDVQHNLRQRSGCAGIVAGLHQYRAGAAAGGGRSPSCSPSCAGAGAPARWRCRGRDGELIAFFQDPAAAQSGDCLAALPSLWRCCSRCGTPRIRRRCWRRTHAPQTFFPEFAREGAQRLRASISCRRKARSISCSSRRKAGCCRRRAIIPPISIRCARRSSAWRRCKPFSPKPRAPIGCITSASTRRPRAMAWRSSLRDEERQGAGRPHRGQGRGHRRCLRRDRALCAPSRQQSELAGAQRVPAQSRSRRLDGQGRARYRQRAHSGNRCRSGRTALLTKCAAISPRDPDFTLSPIPKGREVAFPTGPDGIAAAITGFTFDDAQAARGPRLHRFRAHRHAHLRRADRDRPCDPARARITGPTVSAEAVPGKPDAASEARKIDAKATGWAYKIACL